MFQQYCQSQWLSFSLISKSTDPCNHICFMSMSPPILQSVGRLIFDKSQTLQSQVRIGGQWAQTTRPKHVVRVVIAGQLWRRYVTIRRGWPCHIYTVSAWSNMQQNKTDAYHNQGQRQSAPRWYSNTTLSESLAVEAYVCKRIVATVIGMIGEWWFEFQMSVPCCWEGFYMRLELYHISKMRFSPSRFAAALAPPTHSPLVVQVHQAISCCPDCQLTAILILSSSKLLRCCGMFKSNILIWNTQEH